MFSIFSITNFKFWVAFILSSAIAFNLDQRKILSSVKELKFPFYLSNSPALLWHKGKQAFENIMGKEDYAGRQLLLLFSLRFQPFQG